MEEVKEGKQADFARYKLISTISKSQRKNRNVETNQKE